MFECCDKERIKSYFLPDRDPTVNDIKIDPYTLVVNKATGDLFFKSKDANGNPKITKLGSGGGGGGGVESINGLTGNVVITTDPPLKVTPSGTSLKLTFEDTYIKTINDIPPDASKNFVIDKTDPITVTEGENKVTIGSTGGGGNAGIQKIIIDDGELVPDADGTVTLKGEIAQGTKVIVVE